MPANQIITDIASLRGLDPTNADDKAFLFDRVNDAAKDLYDSTDLVGSVIDGTFQINLANQQVSLPYYVGEVRAVMRNGTRLPIDFNTNRARYQGQSALMKNLLNWRIRGRSPLSTNISNASLLVLTIPAAEAAEFTVIVTGKTEQSGRIEEQVVFAIGDTSKNTTNAFLEVFSIQNRAVHTYDVTVSDVDDTVLATLYNNQTETSYMLVQVVDEYLSGDSELAAVDVLYKKAFVPFRNDYDEFVVPGYDKAIVWKTMEHLTMRQNPDLAKNYWLKCKEVVANMDRNFAQGATMEIQFVRDPMNDVNSYKAPWTTRYLRGAQWIGRW